MVLSVIFFWQCRLALAQEKPLWELGIGLSGLFFPDYRGSNETNYYPIPFPYLIYRGEFFKADRDGVRGTFFDNDRIEFNISVSASLPVNSEDNKARHGMPNLDPTLEIGPSLDINLWRSSDANYKLDLRLPVRTALAIGDTIYDVGYGFFPRLNLDITNPAGYSGWNLGLLAGPIYQSKRSNEYFYSVSPQYATADRPAYYAKAGYAGSQILMSLSKRYKSYWVGAFVRWDSLAGAVFESSPLVNNSNYFAYGIGIAWIIGESSTMVKTHE